MTIVFHNLGRGSLFWYANLLLATSFSTMDVASSKTLVPVHDLLLTKDMADNFENVEQFQARPDDVVISTFPKSGTTWTSEILDMIYCGGDEELSRRDAIYNRVPYLEFFVPGMPSGIDQLNAAPSPRLVKTHLPVHLMPASFWEKNVKVIHVARNAKDVAVSYYYFHKIASAVPDPVSWDVFLDTFMQGNVCYSSWHDQVKGWWEKRHDHRILYLFYEDMKEDLEREIRKILQFLEKEMSDEIVEKIVYHTSFDVMKNNDMANYKTLPSEILNQTISPFMRKGIVGDWKNHFTDAQNVQFAEDYERKMADTDLHFRTEI